MIHLKEARGDERIVDTLFDKVQDVGRVLRKNERMTFDFSNSGVLFQTESESEILIFFEGFVVLNVFVDGMKEQHKIKNGLWVGSYQIMTIPGHKRVEIRKGSEARSNKVSIIGLVRGKIEKGPQPNYKCSAEFIGDSLTCGYGNLGASEFETDCDLTWATIVAKALESNYQICAWSGMGVYVNDVGNTIDQIGTRRKYYVGSEMKDVYDRSQFGAQYVFINIGTNDFAWNATKKVEGIETLFKASMTELIEDCKADYGKEVVIFLIVGPRLSGTDLETVLTIFKELCNKYSKTFIVEVQMPTEREDFWGFREHPSLEGHKEMAKQIIPQVQTILQSMN
ncbi:hypothetical protein EIN_181500 [Entamoeba invadens IP1]|uniref:hypothetical protein n=1 Tax=Entamoeba invadens IP1 TaxID=370355 RepID=UPI0002C3DC7D|nr:hypothetical protein EIN_181500 [Entamoeba invadens IP1]ELP93983.1 hypothetical protein EIN_181500 [Entamoeba invadens IP1]|eukprot:XP_004260754.1 hypothetical protein EIN_181500 [Entamoeba invadens IP1]